MEDEPELDVGLPKRESHRRHGRAGFGDQDLIVILSGDRAARDRGPSERGPDPGGGAGHLPEPRPPASPASVALST